MSNAKTKSKDPEEIVMEYTKYEKARMIGSRALQLSMDFSSSN